MTEQDPEHSARCLNCDAVVTGAYCSQCGQAVKNPRISFKVLAADFAGAAFSLDSLLLRSLKPLVSKPGFLTNAFLKGKRISYLTPLRLYLFCSVMFFILAAVAGSQTGNRNGFVIQEQDGEKVIAWGQQPQLNDDMTEDELMRERILNNRKALDTLREGLESSSETPKPQADPDDVGKTPVAGDVDVTHETPAEAAGQGVNTDGRVGWEIENERVNSFVDRKLEKFMSLGPQGMKSAVRNGVSRAFFLLMPLFALLLKALYFRRDPLYIDHLIFALHVHAFAFACMAVILVAEMILPDWTAWMMPAFLVGGVPWYLFAAMRRVYGQSVGKTLLKLALLCLCYGLALGVGMLISMTVVMLMV